MELAIEESFDDSDGFAFEEGTADKAEEMSSLLEQQTSSEEEEEPPKKKKKLSKAARAQLRKLKSDNRGADFCGDGPFIGAFYFTDTEIFQRVWDNEEDEPKGTVRITTVVHDG